MTRPNDIFDEQVARLALLLHELHSLPALTSTVAEETPAADAPSQCSVDHVDQATRMLEVLRHVH